MKKDLLVSKRRALAHLSLGTFKKTKGLPSDLRVRKMTLGLQLQPGIPKFSLLTLGFFFWAAWKMIPMLSSSLLIMASLDLFTLRLQRASAVQASKPKGKGASVKINQQKSTTPMARVGLHATVAEQQAENSTAKLLTIPRLLVALMTSGNEFEKYNAGPVLHVFPELQSPVVGLNS